VIGSVKVQWTRNLNKSLQFLFSDIAIKNCTKLIKDLNIRINSDKSLRAVDECKHLTAVINLLNVYLKEVLAIVAQLRFFLF